MFGRCHQCGGYCKTRRATYCSPACRQKAYRLRKKQSEISKKNTMHMDDRLVLFQAVRSFPEFKNQFEGFYTDYGVEASVEMLHIVKFYMESGYKNA